MTAEVNSRSALSIIAHDGINDLTPLSSEHRTNNVGHDSQDVLSAVVKIDSSVSVEPDHARKRSGYNNRLINF